MAPRLSVVIPLFEKGPHILRCLESVLGQTVGDLDVVVVDDGSTDEGPDRVRAVGDTRIRLVSQANQGQATARNRGAAEARAELVAFLDADDTWESDHAATLLRLRETFPTAGLLATAYEAVEPDGRRSQVRLTAVPPAPWEGLLPDYFHAAATGEPPVWTSAAAVPADLFRDIGGFRGTCSFGEDLDLWARIACRHRVAFSWRGGAVYRRDSVNRLCLGRLPEGFDGFVEHYLAHPEDAAAAREGSSWADAYVGKLQMEVVARRLQAGDVEGACALLPTVVPGGRSLRWYRTARCLAALPGTLRGPVWHLYWGAVRGFRGAGRRLGRGRGS